MFNIEPSQEVSRIEFNRLKEQVQLLEAEVRRLDELLVNKELELETLLNRMPKTWLLDPNYWKRAFTAYAYVAVVGLIVALPFTCLFLIIFGLAGGFQQ